MNKYLWAAIEAVLQDAEQCGIDDIGYLSRMNASNLAILKIEFQKEQRKHGKFGRTKKS